MTQHDSLPEAVDRGEIDPEPAPAMRKQVRDDRPDVDRLAEGSRYVPDEKVDAIIEDITTHYRAVFDRLADS